jgi:type IV pilus assembly protein PilA
MKSKRGFTLIEIIAVIVILGLIVLIAVPFFQGSLEVVREDYYSALENSILNSSKDFFSDNKLFLPSKFLDTQKINLTTLIEEHYIDDVKDYNGKKCDIKDSYVIVVKTGTEKYEYATCTRCSEDDYDHTDNLYCSEAWDKNKGFTEAVFDAPPDVYIYKGTSREVLKEQVVVYPDIRRCLGTGTCTKEVKRVYGKGDINAQPIYPMNLDSIDTNVVGEYQVYYRYLLQDRDADGNVIEKEGKVIVYENAPADVTFTKYNVVYDDKKDNDLTKKETKEISDTYDPTNRDDWAQKLNIKFNYNKEVDGKKIMVARYQWYLNNRWDDYCVPDRSTNKNNNECDMTIGNVAGGFELDDDIRFRYVDVDGRISQEFVYNIRIDYTAPDVCVLKTTGTYGTMDDVAKTWYVSKKVKVSFDKKDDKATTSKQGGTVKSGIGRYGVSTGKRLFNESLNQEEDTKGIRWYGYIEDKAGNFTTCSIKFKKDSTAPTCTSSGDNTDWKNTPVTVYWGCSDTISECRTGTGSETFDDNDTYTQTWDKSAYDIYDYAGNKKTCPKKTRSIFYDKKAPTCTNSQNTDWTNSPVTISWGCNDEGSGCDPNYSGGSKTFNESTETYNVSAYTIKDRAGNSNSCGGYTSDVKLDVDAPSCTATKSGSGKGGVSTSVTCSDSGGSGYSCPSGESGVKSSRTYTVTDGAGNSANCSVTVDSEQCDCATCGGDCYCEGGWNTYQHACEMGGFRWKCNPTYSCAPCSTCYS